MIWLLITGAILIGIAAALGRPQTCTECGQVINRRDLMAHWNRHHATDRRRA